MQAFNKKIPQCAQRQIAALSQRLHMGPGGRGGCFNWKIAFGRGFWLRAILAAFDAAILAQSEADNLAKSEEATLAASKKAVLGASVKAVFGASEEAVLGASVEAVLGSSTVITELLLTPVVEKMQL